MRENSHPPRLPGWRLGAFLLSLWLSFGALALEPSRSVFQYPCRSWSRQDGLPANGVNAIAQSKDGYLWLGTAAGLVRFDGLEFELTDLNQVPQVRSPFVKSLCAAQNGGLWLGLNLSAFAFSDGRNVSFLGKEGWGGLSLNVTSILEAKKGDLWIAAQTRVSRLTPAGVFETLLPPAGSYESFEVNVVYEDSRGRVWLGTSGKGLFYWEDGVLTKFSDPEIADRIIRTVVEDQEGHLWVGTQLGLLGYDSHFQKLTVQVTASEPRALYVDHRGVLWVGLGSGGVLRYWDGKVSQLRKSDGLADDFVSAIAEDREGSLWVGTRSGLSQLSDIKLPTFDVAEGVPGETKISTAAAPGGGLWVATGSGFGHFNGRAASRWYGAETGLKSSWVTLIREARDGNVYLVTGARDIEVFAEGKIVASYPTKDAPNAIAEDAEGMLVVAGGELYRVSATSFAPLAYAAGGKLSLGYVKNMVVGGSGSLWVASVDGLFQVKDGIAKLWPLENGVPETKVLWVCEDEAGVVWAGLTAGIARLKDGQLRYISRQDGLFGNVIYALVLDDAGDFWAHSESGFFRVSRRSLNAFADGEAPRVECVGYDDLTAVKSAELNQQYPSGSKTQDGRIWFPTARGLVMIDPAHLSTNQIAPPVHLDRVRANGRELPRGALAVVPPGKGELELHFTALSFIAPQKVRFRYQLVGYDPDWVETTDRRLAIYTNLEPGRYQFRVIAANADGVWNTRGDTLEIELRPHFHQTAWFYALCAGLGGAALGGLYAWRIRHLKRKQRSLQAARDLLETEVQSRTAELSREQALLRTLLDNSPDQIYFKDVAGRYLKTSRAQAQNFGAQSPEELIGKTDFDYFGDEHARPALADEEEIIRTGLPLIGKIEREVRKDGQERWMLSSKMPLRNAAREIVGTFGISKDITVMKTAEAKLEQVHKQLLETSRQAGMSEVATNVLHNVGNVLNSVNVSATLIADRVRKSKVPSLAKAVDLMREHEGDLAAFISDDPQGRQLPVFLAQVSQHLLADQKGNIGELESLLKNIEHIKEIVAMQQCYARLGGVKELIDVVDLVEDSLRITEKALHRHGVEVVREFAPVPTLNVEKNKILQILVNLLRNAKHACEDAARKDKRLTVRVAAGRGAIHISVTDNGVGISPENLQRIFRHGFTTRKEGHGFGLHSGALAAKEMGGALTVQSAGAGHGATFTLRLPVVADPPVPSGAALN